MDLQHLKVLFEKLRLHERCENKKLPKTISKQQQSTSEATVRAHRHINTNTTTRISQFDPEISLNLNQISLLFCLSVGTHTDNGWIQRQIHKYGNTYCFLILINVSVSKGSPYKSVGGRAACQPTQRLKLSVIKCQHDFTCCQKGWKYSTFVTKYCCFKNVSDDCSMFFLLSLFCAVAAVAASGPASSAKGHSRVQTGQPCCHLIYMWDLSKTGFSVLTYQHTLARPKCSFCIYGKNVC